MIVQLTTERGSRFAYRARVSARRGANGWELSLLSSEYDGGGPKGEARTAFAAPSYVAGDSDDDARLRVLAADLAAFANRVAEMERSAADAREAALTARGDGSARALGRWIRLSGRRGAGGGAARHASLLWRSPDSCPETR